MADFVDGEVFGFEELTFGRDGICGWLLVAMFLFCLCVWFSKLDWVMRKKSKGTLFEEKSNLITTFQKIAIPDMFIIISFPSTKFSHRMIFEREVIQHRMCFGEERGDCFWGESAGNYQVAISVICI